MAATQVAQQKPDEITALLALLDAFAASSDRFHPSLMLHEADDSGIVEHAFRLWCSANKIAIDVQHVVRDERGTTIEYDTLSAIDLGAGRYLHVFTKPQSVELPQPVSGVVIRMPPVAPVARVVEPEEPKTIDEACERFSLLELD